jgi:hypothetical protein
MSSWLDEYPDDASPPATKATKATNPTKPTKPTGSWLDTFPDDSHAPTATAKPARSVVDPDMPHTTAEHWNGTSAFPGMKARSIAKQNAARSASESEDEEHHPVRDDVAAGLLGAANSMDSLGLADEVRGALAAGAEPWKALASGKGVLGGDPIGAYQRARDDQRAATAQAEADSPMASWAGQTLGQLPSVAGSIVAKAPQLAAQAVTKAPSILNVLAKSGLLGAGFGAASGLGHGEGDLDAQIDSSMQGATGGALLGVAGATLPALTARVAPKAAAMAAGAGLRAAPREAAGNVANAAGRAGRSTLAGALDALAAGVGKAPLAGGAAVGGHLGGPVGAGVGGLVGQKVLGAQADALAGKLSSKANAVRAKNAPPTKLRGLLDDAFAAPQLTSPSGLALDTATPKVNAEMARMKRAIADEQSVPVADEDVVSAESATNPWAQAMANAREGGAPPPVPPQSRVMKALVDAGFMSPTAKGGPTWSLSSQALRSGEMPASVRARLQQIAEDAAKAEPSTTADASGAAGFDDGASPAVDAYGVPLDQFPLEDSVPDRPAAKRAQRMKPRPASTTPAPPPSSAAPDTAVMTNPSMGRLRLQASRENPAGSPWSDAIDASERPAFDEHGNELLNPAVRESWRAAAARHAAPVEGGPSSPADMLDGDVAALLSRGSRTKGGLQRSSAYHAKRNALLGEQSGDLTLDPSLQQSAQRLLDTSRTAHPSPSDFAASMKALPPAVQDQALEIAGRYAGPEYVDAVRAELAAGFDEPLPSFVTKTADEMGFSGKDEPRSSTWQRREGGSGVLSASAEQRAAKLDARHAREDALPADRATLLQQLLEANGIGDHDSARADAAYLAWKRGGRRGPKPAADLGGMLDAFQAAKEGKAPSSLLEAFEQETRGLKTYRDLVDALPALSDALLRPMQLPDEVVQRHLTQDLERDE